MSTHTITPQPGEKPLNPPMVPPNPTHEEMMTEEDSREKGEDSHRPQYEEGRPMTFVKVRFPGNAKSFAFFVGKRKIRYGRAVVAMSDRGMAVGHVNSFPYDLPFKENMLPLQHISRLATPEDVLKDREHFQREMEANALCKNLVTELDLPMELTHVQFIQFGKKAVFYFIAPERVDFRELVKRLVKSLNMRIELRQIGVRDRTAALGGIGPCGRQLCCSSFLERYGNVNIKMAKNQNLTLMSNRLNGVCGQIKCCVSYEDEVYKEKRQALPKIGDITVTKNGDKGRVTRLHLLLEQFEMMTNQGQLRRYSSSQFISSNVVTDSKEQESFPSDFDKILDELQTLIQ